MASKVSFLPKGMGSLSRGLPPSRPGTLFVLGSDGGMSVSPDAGFRLLFGRNQPDVHVCVGVGDTCVSRRHGLITHEYSRWVLRNTGKLPIRFPGSRLVLSGDEAELPTGYTPLFIVAPRQEHLLEVRIAAGAPPRAGGGPELYGEETLDRDARDLSGEEKLVLVCLAQRYLRNDPQPQPLTWAQVAFELAELRPAEQWSAKRAAHIVARVRKRLSARHGVPGLLEEEVPQPVGNALNHHLITDLLVTTTIARADLHLLGPRHAA
ncbi:hypothetical protein GCM10018793_05420 [Streptomyces sulfonofaciens]|uniref:FHA domain-containing protein n=1 Tax=Streptomyces sulfonofaciens TaxID=68272 RepID=A0A919KSY0_9ACTN|nr:hypothetical protein [Streptomyces sulfonofaciens]GHH70811.1 hypothetical protein GCM10018793_05420 [Streptomyces sulfonofaciens]